MATQRAHILQWWARSRWNVPHHSQGRPGAPGTSHHVRCLHRELTKPQCPVPFVGHEAQTQRCALAMLTPAVGVPFSRRLHVRAARPWLSFLGSQQHGESVKCLPGTRGRFMLFQFLLLLPKPMHCANELTSAAVLAVPILHQLCLPPCMYSFAATRPPIPCKQM